MKTTKANPIPYSKNAKRHPDTQLRSIALSLREYGWRQPIVVDKDNEIIVGHGRWAAYEKYPDDIKEPWIVKADDLTPAQVKGYRLMDNKTNESDWDMDLVVEELRELDALGFDLELTGFDSDLLLSQEEKDDMLPLEAPTRAKRGDLWLLGPHKVLCGDSTKKEDVERLLGGVKADMIFTDPPYNVDYDNDFRGTKHRKIENDKMSRTAFRDFLAQAVSLMIENCSGGIYICMSAKEAGSLKDVFKENGGHWADFIIWVKNHFTLSRSDYQHQYEFILYGWKETAKRFFVDERDNSDVWEDINKVKTEYDGTHTTIFFQGFRVRLEGKVKGEVIRKKQRTDIWRHDKPSASADHPTMKPVSLITEALMNSSKKENIILDTFLGSGSTLIASEKMGRICYGMELDEKYVDVILKRWEEYTGKTATKA